jgi:chorismate mutase
VEAVIAERKEYIERIARFKSAEGINNKLSAPLND